MKSAVSAPRPRRRSQKSVEATRQARARSPFSSSSREDRDERGGERLVGDEAADEVRHLERGRERVDPRALDAEVAARDDLADEPEDAREARRSGEDGGRDGEPPAVRALRRRARARRPPGSPVSRSPLGGSSQRLRPPRLCYDRRRPHWGLLFVMPNIQQQKKRVRIAARQRLENLRYRSTIKTLTKRLETAVEDGDADAVATERRSLEKLIDRAAARGALHKNAAARKKSQAAKLVSALELLDRRVDWPPAAARARDVEERALELEVACEAAPALQRGVELGDPDDRVPQLLHAEVARLPEELLHVVRAALQPPRRLPRRDALGRERLALAHAARRGSRAATRGGAAPPSAVAPSGRGSPRRRGARPRRRAGPRRR